MAEDISTLVMRVTSDGIKQGASDLDKLTKAADKAEAAVKKLGTSVVLLNSQFSTGTASAAAMLASLERLSLILATLTTNQIRTTRTTQAHNESMREAAALARGLSGSFGALWVTYGNFAGMAIGIALGAGLKGIVTVGKDVEHTLEKIRVLGEATVGEVDQMRQAIYSLGDGVNGPKDVAEALSVLTMAGLNAKEAMQGVGAALSLAIAGDVSIEKSATTLVQVGTALGYVASDFNHIADVIAKTAAVSMSSVDSIAGAFKSAAAVGEVYGASLQDIGLGLAAVANLGIQGTAAGTALKNFYKDLASGADKVVQNFKAMKMSGDDLKDLDGNFLPLIDVIKKLDAGFEKLKAGQRQKAMDVAFGERGIKEGAALIKMLHTVSDELDVMGNKYGNKLEEVNDRIAKSYAFSTLSAIAMAQTTNNQVKSIGNTINKSFAQAFTDLQPEINGTARALKAAFGSPEFVNGIKAIALAVVEATRFLAEHIKQVGYAAAAYVAWKLVAFATGLVQIGLAFTVASTGARAFAISLGPVAVAIVALGAAWAIYNANKDRSITDRDSAKNLTEYNEGVLEAAKKEKEILEMRKSGISESDILRKQQDSRDREASALAIAQSAKTVNAMKAQNAAKWADMQEEDRRLIIRARAMGKTRTGFSGIDEYLENVEAATSAEARHERQVKSTQDVTQRLVETRKANADAADAAAKALRVKPHGDIDINSVKVDKGAITAAYSKAIAEQDGIIKTANAKFAAAEDVLNSEFRAGRMGRIELIESLAKREIEATNTIRTAMEAKVRIAKGADGERFGSELEANKERAAQADVMRAKFTAEEIRKVEQDAAKYEVKRLEDQGNWAQAAHLKFIGEHGIMFAQATSDAIAYGEVYPHLWKKVEEYTERAKAAVTAGEVREAMASFELAAERTGNLLKGVQTATEGSGMAGMWNAATAASTAYTASLVDLKAKQQALESKAAGGSSEDKTKAQEALKEITSLAEKHKTMWIGVGTSIANSLEKGFGRGGKAMGELVKATISFDKLSDKSATSKVKYYGEAADAAKGFFAEGSRGYKTLEGVSKVFHMAEMAQTLGLINLKAIMAVMNQGGGDPYTAFARMAAMAAIVGALGFAVGGGFSDTSGGGKTAEEVQKSQGTGSVFGDKDAKSESIAKSLDYLESNSDVMLPLTQGMLQSLRNIETSMGGLANQVLQVNGLKDGANLGIKEGTTKSSISWGAAIVSSGVFAPITKLLGSLWGKTKTNIVDAGLQFGGKVSDLQNGNGYNQYASVDTTKSSWFGLSKKTTNSVQTQAVDGELSSQFGLVFTNLENALKLVGPTFGKTAQEVTSSIDNLVVSSSMSLKGLEGQALTDAISAVMSKTMDEIAQAAFPAMTDFRQVGEGYAQTVIRVASGIEQAQVAMEGLGLTAITYTEVVNKQGDVAMEMAKQTILAAEGMNGITAMLEGVGSTMGELVTMYKSLIDIRKQMNAVNLNGANLNVNVVKGAGGVSELGSALKSYEENFFTDGEKAAIMLKSVTAEFAKLGLGLPKNNAELRRLIETTGVGTEANSKLTGKLLVLSEAYATLTEASESAREEQSSALRSSIDDLKRFIDTIKAFREALLLGSLSTFKPEEKFAEAKRQYEDTLAKALNGDTIAQGKVTTAASAYLEASKIVNASSSAYGESFSQVQRDLMGLEAYAGTQLTETQRQLAALDAQVNGIATLNVTAEAIRQSLENTRLGVPITGQVYTDIPTPPPVVMPAQLVPGAQPTDNAFMLERINQTLEETKASTEKKMDDLYAVVYDAQDRSTNKLVENSEGLMNDAMWSRKQGNSTMIER